ncbi:hypothetical protein MCAG_02474 [Micromonospora sp. ATCC 39149]|nr:hypothetical protein MCAG_02474 [Micromonospora sp. ATCC 39149]
MRRVKLFAGLGHVARYAAGAGLSWLVFPVEAALIYVVLLVASGLFGLDPGGPLAGPTAVLLATVLGTAVTALVTLPAVLFGDLVARRTRSAAAPVTAVIGGMVLLAAYVWGWGIAVQSPPSQTAIVWGLVVALSVLPLLAFLVVTHSAGAVVALITAAVARRDGKPRLRR